MFKLCCVFLLVAVVAGRTYDFHTKHDAFKHAASMERQFHHSQGFNKPSFNSFDTRSFNSFNKPSFNKPSFNKPSFNKPSFNKPSFNKPSFNRFSASPSYEHVIADVHNVEDALSKSSLPFANRYSTMNNADQIVADVKQMEFASPERRAQLAEALKVRESMLDKSALQTSKSALKTPVSSRSTAQMKVLGDIREMEEALVTAPISLTQKNLARTNLEAIKHDAKEMSSASQDRQSNLREAMSLRTKAVAEILNSPTPASDPNQNGRYQSSHTHQHMFAPSSSAEAQVEQDIQKVMAKLPSSGLSSTAQQAAKVNMRSLKGDAREFLHASPSRQQLLKKDMEERTNKIQQLVVQKSAQQVTSSSHSDQAKVEADVARFIAQLPTSGLSQTIQNEVSDNLKQIQLDTRELAKASPSRQSSLKTAIKDRTEAIEMLVDQNNVASYADEEETQAVHHLKKSHQAQISRSHYPAEAKIEADVESFENKLPSSGLPQYLQNQISARLQEIEFDAREMTKSSASQRLALKNDIADRTASIEMLVDQNQYRSNADYDEDSDY